MILNSKIHPVSDRRRSDSEAVVEERLMQTSSFDCALPYRYRSAQELVNG